MGPETLVSTSLVGGRFADYAECPEFLFADARTSFAMPYRGAVKDIEPRLRSFEYLGGNRVRVTYEWIVNDTLDRDLTCFVHGVGVGAASPEAILFQQDHALPKPTGQWRKGEVIVDGPYEFSLPPTQDRYDLVIGLYKGDRVALKGIRMPGNRIVLGRLITRRDGAEIKNITMKKPARADYPREEVADFNVRLNPEGTWIEFGKLATDGSVKVNREAERLVLFPYPRDRQFRVQLDLKALAPSADASRAAVRALAGKSREDLGPVDCRIVDGRLSITLGKHGAGQYVITWR